jgi:alpha-N-acetylglucosamine transferase
VMMHYEGTPRDDEYLLGLRVLIRSIQDTKTPHDIVVITSDNVRPETNEALLADGAKLHQVPNLQNPFEKKEKGRNSYKDRFKYSFNKLYTWNMTDYERVAFLDSDNIFLTNMDEIFMCGHFCIVYMNPLIFHTGLIVVKPSTEMFYRLVQGQSRSRTCMRYLHIN